MPDNIINKIELEGNELIVRTGSAPNIHDPMVPQRTGTITAPADYAEWEIARLKRLSDAPEKVEDLLEGHVEANYTARTIKLVTHPREKTAGAMFTGELKLFPALEGLTINVQKTYDKAGLLKMLKFQRAYFADRDAHAALIEQLKKFEAKVAQEFKNQDDYKGTAAMEKLTKITTNIPLEFSLAMPIFTGGPVEKFTVDICVGLGNGGVDFWLESPDLHDLIITGTEALFEEQLERLKQFVIVKQY